jgi:hypothetical protein
MLKRMKAKSNRRSFLKRSITLTGGLTLGARQAAPGRR